MVVEQSESWVLKFTHGELLLVCKALGGRLKPDEVEEARMLDRQIGGMRVRIAHHNYGEALKLDQNLRKGECPTSPISVHVFEGEVVVSGEKVRSNTLKCAYCGCPQQSRDGIRAAAGV